MKKRELTFLLVSGIILTTQADAARGRQPCSGSKGGIAHCTSDGRFVCNDGTLSQSKRFCSGYSPLEGSNRLIPSTSSRKKQMKKITTAKKQKQQRVTENDEPANTKARQSTCAPLYMANKPGYTHLPICSGNQY